MYMNTITIATTASAASHQHTDFNAADRVMEDRSPAVEWPLGGRRAIFHHSIRCIEICMLVACRAGCGCNRDGVHVHKKGAAQSSTTRRRRSSSKREAASVVAAAKPFPPGLPGVQSPP